MKLIIFTIAFWSSCICSLPLRAYAMRADSSMTSDSTVQDTTPSTTTVTHLINPSLGATYQNTSKSGEENESLQWLFNLQARFQYESPSFSLVASLNSQFGQVHRRGAYPEKTQDNLIGSVTPSMLILPKAGIRLFLETTGETTMKAGMIDTAHTEFLDPLFLYQSLFVGQRFTSAAADGSGDISFTYGVGYAVQQTITHHFILQPQRQFKASTDNPLSTIDVETGMSALVDLQFHQQITSGLQLNISSKTVYLGKQSSWSDYTKARISSLGTLSLSYAIFNIEYTMHLIYDSNYSLRRQLDQTLVAGLRFTL